MVVRKLLMVVLRFEWALDGDLSFYWFPFLGDPSKNGLVVLPRPCVYGD